MQDVISERSGAIASLMEERLGVRGRGLERKLHKAGRKMPRWVRNEARQLVEAERLMGHPKLAMQADPSITDQAYARCQSWLKTVDPSERRKSWWLSLAAANAFNLLVVGAIVVLALSVGGFV